MFRLLPNMCIQASEQTVQSKFAKHTHLFRTEKLTTEQNGGKFGCRRREDLRKWGDVCLVAEVGELWDPINWASWWFIYSKGRPLIGFLVCTMPPWRHGRGHQSCLHTSIKLQEGTLSIIFVEFFILSEGPIRRYVVLSLSWVKYFKLGL